MDPTIDRLRKSHRTKHKATPGITARMWRALTSHQQALLLRALGEIEARTMREQMRDQLREQVAGRVQRDRMRRGERPVAS